MMQVPELPAEMQWKVCANTSVEYSDDKDIEAYTAFLHKKTLRVPARTVIVLEAEPNNAHPLSEVD